MPSWDNLVISFNELLTLPIQWKNALEHWRGIYLIIDKSDGKAYIGSAYGEDNILGRWISYAKTGHGGNVELKGRKPNNFMFSILQRLSPDLDPSDVIKIETTWKLRLHTKEYGLNRN